jgi:hypothetical protein
MHVHVSTYQAARAIIGALRRHGHLACYVGHSTDLDGEKDYVVEAEAPRADLDFLVHEATEYWMNTYTLNKVYTEWLARPWVAHPLPKESHV